MAFLVLGLVTFFFPHVLRELNLRDRLRKQLPNVNSYIGIYALLSFTGLVLIIWGKATANFHMIWEPPFAQRYISSFLMIPAFILLVSGNIRAGYIRWHVRNPMLLGVILWAVAHLWANGDLASVVLFGSFAAWGGLKFATLYHLAPLLEPELKWLWRDLFAVILGSIIYVMVYVSHGQLFGVGLAI